MKPKLKPSGTKRSKVNCDIQLSTFAFKFNLRRYNQAGGGWRLRRGAWRAALAAAATLPQLALLLHELAEACGRDKVGRCRLTHETQVESAWR
jgi:hypothetical protein